jgi:hypothetical protein
MDYFDLVSANGTRKNWRKFSTSISQHKEIATTTIFYQMCEPSSELNNISLSTNGRASRAACYGEVIAHRE